MKTITPAMKAHIESDVTTLATCWNIVRQDGVKFFYTEHDQDISFEGEIYKATGGFNKSAIKSNATLGVDELEVSGFLEDAGISDDEMRNGAFDFAKCEVFAVNYEDLSPTMGIIKLRSGFFGEVRTADSGAFAVELRGLVDMLGQKIGDTYLPECRLDLGSEKCGVKLWADDYEAGRIYEVGDRVRYPVNDPHEFNDRHYPRVISPNVPGIWQDLFVTSGDLNMDVFRGPKALLVTGSSNGSGGGFFTGVTLNQAALEITEEEKALGAYQLTIKGRYYSYFKESVPYIGLACKAGFLQLNYKEADLKQRRPGRHWYKFEVSVPLHAATTHIGIDLGCKTIASGSQPSVAFDDLDIFIEPKNKVNLGYLQYGNREFVATTGGLSSTTTPDWPMTVGADTTDGDVVWETRLPQYLFVLQVAETATNAYQFKLDLDAIGSPPEDYFHWGVCKFIEGLNVGRSMEAMNVDVTTGIVRLALPLPYAPQAGDWFMMSAGCDKRIETCRDRFANFLNYRGFPMMPGEGQYFKIAGA